MKFRMPSFMNNLWERTRSGDNWYYLPENGEWGLEGTNLEIAQNHPILTPAMLFVSKIYSQAEFWIEDKTTGEKYYTHPSLELLARPNYYQIQSDFLEEAMFVMLAQGVAIIYMKKGIGAKEPSAMYILDKTLIKWPEGFTTPLAASNKNNPIQNKSVKYDEDGLNLTIKIKHLLFLYDLPNGMNKKNMFKAESRLKGLKQTLINTNDSLVAKNIILKTNGKELITGEKEGFPLDEDEKIEAEALFNQGYGLGKRRKRGLITKASVNWKSLHIALRDLGLDESVKVDGNLIYTALHIPKDILSLEAKKTTYNNFKESMTSYIQNEIQASLNTFVEVMNLMIEDKNLKLVGSYDSMPIMQYVKKERYDAEKARAEALQALLDVGIPQGEALMLCGFPRDMILTPKPEPDVSNETIPAETGEEE